MKTKNILIGGAAAAAIYYLYSKKSAAPTTTVVAPAVINPSTGTGTVANSDPSIPYVPITIDTNMHAPPKPTFEIPALGAMAPRLVITDVAKMQSWNCINNPTAPGCNVQKVSWNCQKNPTAPGCNVQKVSWNCQKNPTAPGCNPSRNMVYNDQAFLLKAQAAETLR